MAFYDAAGKKIGRNSACPCGSGKKFKHCHGRPNNQPIRISNDHIPEEVLQKLKEKQAIERAFKVAHGKGKPIISTEFKDHRFVAVGNELHYAKKETAKYFPDFLGNYIRAKLGVNWGNSEIAKPLEERHQVLKWYESMHRFKKQQTPEEDGTYRTPANGAMLSWYRLAYDLYLIKHNAALQKKILRRLRNKLQFQGARFELCVTASMIIAGFEIDFEDERDPSRKHAEFLARDCSGLEIAVEAKSRHRDGILDFKVQPEHSGKDQSHRVAVESLIRKALVKEPAGPYFIFIDVNMPYSDESYRGNPWFKEMAETVEKLRKEWESGTFPANAIFFCNDPTYQEPEIVPKKDSFWCYEVLIDDPKYPLPNPHIAKQIAPAVIKRTNIPNEYPEK
jgi:hypothetical protein